MLLAERAVNQLLGTFNVLLFSHEVLEGHEEKLYGFIFRIFFMSMEKNKVMHMTIE